MNDGHKLCMESGAQVAPTSSGGDGVKIDVSVSGGSRREDEYVQTQEETEISVGGDADDGEWSVEICDGAQVLEKEQAQQVVFGLCSSVADVSADSVEESDADNVDVVTCACDLPCYIATAGDKSRFAGLEYARCDRARKDRCKFWVIVCPECAVACVPTRAEESEGAVHETFRCPQCQFSIRDEVPVPRKFL